MITLSGTPSALSSPALRRRALGPGHRVQRVLSSDSISSGYSTDMYLPVDSDTLDTGDYELWERRHSLDQPRAPPQQQQHQYDHHPQQQYQHSSPKQKKNLDRPSNKEVWYHGLSLIFIDFISEVWV